MRNEKLAALATLSASAAHEFSTPLSTIAVAAGEMYNSLAKREDCQILLSDVQLIRDQVKRCKDILYHLAAEAGEPLGEIAKSFTCRQLLEDILAQFSPADRQRIQTTYLEAERTVYLPYRTFKRTIKGLIKNALDASSDSDAAIMVSCQADPQYLFVVVEDKGIGMDDETRLKAIEPFYTTKEQGKGLGLGLFLARSVAEMFGGALEISSTPWKGTRVCLSISWKQMTNTL